MNFRSFVICFLIALILSFVLLTFVIMTGQTFGQRAAKQFLYGSKQWTDEVYRLAHEK